MPSARLGLIVPKKGNPKAVRRNRIKRIVRDSFRRHYARLPALDMVVQVYGQIEDDRLHEVLERQWREIELNCGS